MQNRRHVLFIFPLARDYVAIESFSPYICNDYKFHFLDSEHFGYSSKASDEFSLVKFIDKACKAVEELNIDIVLSTRDMGDLVCAALAYKHIKGCNHYIGTFIALYKPYTRQLLDTIDNGKYNINYEIVNTNKINTSNNTFEYINYIVNTKMNNNGFLKPPAASCGSLVGHFHKRDEFLDIINMHLKYGKKHSHYLPEFVKKCMNINRINNNNNNNIGCDFDFDFNMVSSNIDSILLCEEFMDTSIKVTVDGCVVNKEIYMWAIVENIYWNEINKNECLLVVLFHQI